MNRFSLVIKRVFDILCALGGLIVLSPVLLICAILIRTKLGSPIFFRQKRIGKGNKEFEMIKFRTMKDAVDKNGNQLPDELRMTKLGKTLRSLSLDELPELINILKGDMSLIGPRPERPELTYKFEKEIPGFIKRLTVKPGLTGLAQVNGGYEITPNEKLKWDLIYIKNRNIIMDMKIILKTVRVVFTGDGAR